MVSLLSNPFRRALILIWAFFIIKSTFYCFLFPLWEGFDEFAHYGFVQYIAVQRGLPEPDARLSRDVEESLALSPLPWTLRDWLPPHVTHDGYWQLAPTERDFRGNQLRNIPNSLRQQSGVGYLYEGKQPPLYYWILSMVFGSLSSLRLIDAVFILRLVSIMIASIVVPVTFVTAEYVFHNKTRALQVTALVAALPGLYIDIARVGNDSLAIPLFSLFVYACVRTTDEPRHISWAAFFLALGLLTKAYFVTAIPVFVLLFIWTAYSQPRRAFTLPAIFSIALLGGIPGWWYYRVLQNPQSGFWIDTAASQSTGILNTFRQIPSVDWRNALHSISGSHIWVGGWSFLQVRTWMYQVFEGMLFLAVLGSLLALFGYSADLLTKIRRAHLVLLGGIYGCFLAGMGYHVLVNSLNAHISTSPGWYLYAAILPEALLISIGLLLLTPTRWRAIVLPVSTGCFALLELYTVHFQLIPYYTGFIAHGPSGAVHSFYLSQLRDGGLATMFARLCTNKPEYLSMAGMACLWLSFVLATVGIIAVTSWAANESKRDPSGVQLERLFALEPGK